MARISVRKVRDWAINYLDKEVFSVDMDDFLSDFGLHIDVTANAEIAAEPPLHTDASPKQSEKSKAPSAKRR